MKNYRTHLPHVLGLFVRLLLFVIFWLGEGMSLRIHAVTDPLHLGGIDAATQLINHIVHHHHAQSIISYLGENAVPCIRNIRSEELWLYKYPRRDSYVPNWLLWAEVFSVGAYF